MYEYRYNIIYYNIIPVLIITTWIFGWFTIHLFTFYVLFLTLVSLTLHNSNFDKRVITYSVAYINSRRYNLRTIHPSIHPSHSCLPPISRVCFYFPSRKMLAPHYPIGTMMSVLRRATCAHRTRQLGPSP